MDHEDLQTAEVHVAPVHDAVQAQVLGAVQVPPLEHVGEQTARDETRRECTHLSKFDDR